MIYGGAYEDLFEDEDAQQRDDDAWANVDDEIDRMKEDEQWDR